MSDIQIPATTDPARGAPDPAAVPTEHLEARICELAGHLTAATCRFLLLVADFDARKGWAAWEMPSCAAWLSWKCQVAPGTAREQVRVARALAGLPVIRAEFAAARLSYAKVRALTRIAVPETERDLAAMALPMTAGQLERFARAHRRVTAARDADARKQRRLSWGWVDDHVLMLRGLLPADGAAVLLQALRAARNDLEHPHDDDHGGSDGGGVSAETRAGHLAARDKEDNLDLGGDGQPPIRKEHAEDLADALVEICAAYLRTKIVSADNADVYQVIIHAGTEAITAGETGEDVTAGDGVSAETPATHPAFPLRCHFEDSGAVSPAALRLIACNATISTMVHDTAGNVLNVGRRTRKPSAALRRAVRERDGCRCRFPGCESRRTDAHHILYWSNGGETKLANLVSLCKAHHRIVHDKGIIITATAGEFAFYLPGGVPISSSPPLPEVSGDISTCHSAAIDPATIIPPHSGERLDLNMAIWVALTNARIQAERRQAQQATHTQAA
jgi:Domain of unknown function (DUF222)/HNH endonuclease